MADRDTAGSHGRTPLAVGRRVVGVVEHGDHRGRELGYPTANVAVEVPEDVPDDGVFAGWFALVDPPAPGDTQTRAWRPAVVSVGANVVFGARTRTVEAHLLDVDEDLYGRRVAVEFVERVRDMSDFPSVDALLRAMDGDTAAARVVLARTTPPADVPAGRRW